VNDDLRPDDRRGYADVTRLVDASGEVQRYLCQLCHDYFTYDELAESDDPAYRKQDACRACVLQESCTCPRIALGLRMTEVRNWSGRCPVHGYDTAWLDAKLQEDPRWLAWTDPDHAPWASPRDRRDS